MSLLDGIDVKCPACGRRSRYPVVHAGTTASCPSCKHEHIIPNADGTGLHPVVNDKPAAPPAPPPAAKKAPPPAKMGDAEKILFVCGSCQYRARIPAQYAGMAVRCPSCDAAQIANTDDAAGTTGNTVQLSKIPTAGHKTVIRPGNILFICSQCNFEAQLAKHYVGKAIRCPGCHAPQVVAGEAPVTDPGALERNPGAPTTPTTPAADPRFICVGCGYRARIPSQYMGLAVTCPKCDTVQIATPEEQESASTGDTVAISKIDTAKEGAKIANPQVAVTSEPTIAGPSPKPAPPAAPGDKVRFTCSSCGFKARIPASYAGENIHCPSCNAVQLVLRSGQLSPNATGNTQVLQVVQTAADGAASPDAIATPTNTPSRGVPIISDTIPPPPPPPPPPPAVAATAKPLPPKSTPAKPAATPPVAKAVSPGPAIPPAAVPVAQPAGTAAQETSIDDLLNFEDPPEEEKKDDSKFGKVVRRGSDRFAAVKSKTPLPEPELAAPKTKAAAPSAQDSDDKPSSSANKPSKGTGRVERSSPPARAAEPAPAKSSNGMTIVVAIIGLGLLAGLGGLGYLVMEGQKQMADMRTDMNTKLDGMKKELADANEKLTKAEEEAKLAKEAADLAQKKTEEEAAARKVAEEASAALEAKLKAAEEAAAKAAEEKAAAEAAAKAAAEKAGTDKPEPEKAPTVNEPPPVTE